MQAERGVFVQHTRRDVVVAFSRSIFLSPYLTHDHAEIVARQLEHREKQPVSDQKLVGGDGGVQSSASFAQEFLDGGDLRFSLRFFCVFLVSVSRFPQIRNDKKTRARKQGSHRFDL